MKKLFVIIVLALVQVAAMAQGTKTTGRITDAATGMPLEGASVTLKSTGMGTSTDVNGRFSLLSAKTGKITLRISYVGYADVEKVVEAGASIDITLKEEQGRGNDVVVSASKRPEKITRAPATISVINAKDLEQTSSFNIGELASKIQGVEFVRTGVNGVGFNARGFNNAFNAKILQMTDGRNSMMAGGSGLPSGIMNTVIKEDVERLEIVLGPNSALYGPNAHNGIANTITKDPRKYQGTTLVIGAGNRDVFSGRFRTASKINNKWAYKITGEYTTGRDFEFNDSIYAGGSVYGPALAIPERIPNYNFKHVRGAADVYYAVNSKSDIIVSYGGSNNNF